MIRGTRGFVITAEDSTGSVGESRAPTQEGLGPAEVRERVGRQGHQHAGERHGEHELPERQVPRLLEHLLLHLEAVAEQDHDQRDHREPLHELRRRVELEHLEPALAQQEARDRRRPPSATGTTCARAPR